MRCLFAPFIISVFTSLGCGGQSPAKPAAPKNSAETQQQMHINLRVLDAVYVSILQGELEDAKQTAASLTSLLRNESYPPSWRPHLQSMRKQLWGLNGANDLGDAALRFAKTGKVCGECHQQLGIQSQTFGDVPEPFTNKSLGTHMDKQRWVSETMWSSIVGPSELGWKWAVEGITSSGLSEEEMTEFTPAMRALEQSLNAQLNHAKNAETVDDRVEIFAGLFATCASCHRMRKDSVD